MAFETTQTTLVPFVILRLPQVLARLSISRSTLYSWINQGKFPKPIKLGGTDKSASGWLESDIQVWLQTLKN